MVEGVNALFEPSPTRMAASSLTQLTSWGRGILIKLQACWQKLCSFDSRPGSLCFLQEQPWENVP